MTSRRIVHFFVPAGGLALAFALILPGCFPTLTGAPCMTEANCLEGQVCVSGHCALVGGETGGGGGTVPGDAGGGTGGGSGGGGGGTTRDGGGKVDGGSKDAGSMPSDAGPVFDGGTGEGNKGSCYDGIDNDGDSKADCADSECAGQACRPPVGECDVVETCVANTATCPPDRVAQAGTKCGPTAGCTDGVVQPQSTCNANGSCQLAVSSSCQGFACNGNSCRTSCSADTDCDSTHYCQKTTGACVKKADPGANCTAPNECGTGHCAANVCCNSDCTGDCDSCANTQGLCTHAPIGSDPKNKCTPGTCGESGACSNVCSGSVCGNLSCNKNALCIGGQCAGLKSDNLSCKAPCECNSMQCTLYYVDNDGDGYGDINAAPIGFCGGPVTKPGYATNNADTCDGDPGTNPKVSDTTYFALPNKCGNFDWNSNGSIEYEGQYSCVRSLCISGIAPDTQCGNKGFVLSCSGILCQFTQTTTQKIEQCH